MKSNLLFSCSLFLVSMNVLAAQDLECIADHRPADGNLISVTLKKQPDSTYDILYSSAGGGFGPGESSPSIIGKQIASGLKCIFSKLDTRILQCTDDSFSTVLSSTLVNRSELVALGKGNVTHKMNESVEIEIYAPNFERQLLSFGTKECNVK